MEIKEVFEPIISFVKGFQKKEKDISKQAAKDRLKLVLMQDRASVSPDFFEMMKKEIIDVIKKYIEIDEESLEVQLTRGYEAGLEGPALYANIPIKNIKPVASTGDENEEIELESIAGEIIDEVKQRVDDDITIDAEIETVVEENVEPKIEEKVEKMVENIMEEVAKEKEEKEEKEEEERNVDKEIKEEEQQESADVIAENVAKEMKKSATKSTSKGTRKTKKH